MTWQLQAVCVGDDRITTDDPMAAREAVKVCAACPVKAECDRSAQSQRVFEGVAGRHWWVSGRRKPLPKIARQFMPEELRAGHAAYVAGDHSEPTYRLEQAYQRSRYQARKRREAAA